MISNAGQNRVISNEILMCCEAYLVQIIRILKGSPTTIAVIRRMFFVNVFLEPSFSAKDASAVSTFVPMLCLLMRQAELSVVGRPSSEAPAAFYLVGMCVAVVEMLSNTLGFKSPATACIHCGRGSKLDTSVGWEDCTE